MRGRAWLAAAWERLVKRGSKDFADWVSVGRALLVGRSEAMKLANTNKPHGKRYTAVMRHWLDANGMGGMTQPERHSATRMVENLPAVAQWREGLDEVLLRRLQHPDSVWMHFKRSGLAPAPKVYSRKQVEHAVPTGESRHAKDKTYVRPVYWGQSAIARAAEAMRESRSTDWLVLARLALEAAVRDENDLLEILDARPRRVPPKAAAELVAA